ncbi:GH43 family beta-xylosidase [Paenibacillus endophyticus]|uniref:GH43 family beta-xylosidase n=1 Tax=Paenibacillus endophyticus TaxID=1294268 RepID=A0A7W5C4N8_9BACL|nr:glycoside hydrolase family 43 protein [Paenibacillus endophyticus]MBB3150690.1 GH43 family beta-xylosidase [Paenibacillus endophyticus]
MDKRTQADGMPLNSADSYRNPLPIKAGEGQAEPLTLVHPDPYVLKHNGCYYTYATSEAGVIVLRSDDLLSWEHLGIGFQMGGRKNYWAPAAVYENGRFYLYVSSMPEHAEDVHEERLMVAVSETPEGPFEYVRTFYDTFSLDAHVVKDEHGDYYMFYSNNEYSGVDRDRAGTVILVDRLLDMVTPAGEPRIVVVPTIDEEIYEENRFGDGRDWHTIEGAFYLKRGLKHYMMYSGNAYVRPNYFLGYSVADASKDQSLLELDWLKYPSDDQYEPLLRKNEGVEGVGHNSVIRGPNNIDQWVFYHGRNADDVLDMNREQRTMRADPLLWNGDRLYIAGPSYKAQPAPARPALRDLFDGSGESLGGHWLTNAGDWSQANREAFQANRAVVAGAVTREPYTHYVLEASMKWHHDHTGGLYGIYAAYLDESSYVSVLFDVGRRVLRAQAVYKGVQHEAIEHALPETFHYGAFHLLRVEKTGRHYVIKLDGVAVIQANFPIVSGSVGMHTRYTSAAFAGFEVTRHAAMSAENGSAFAELLERVDGDGICRVIGGELHCRSHQNRRTSWKMQPSGTVEASNGFRFETDILIKRGAAFGMLASYSDERNGVEVILNRAAESITVTQYSEGAPNVILTASLAADSFDWTGWHTISSTVAGGSLTIRVDEHIWFADAIDGLGGAPGFIGTGEASFRETSFTAL